ncbi:serine-type endopeptidase activity protein [Homalodisca vitripennis]|nr:serine-type endopeptidase activity protein [Homalodisca vitripennis]
MFFFRRHQRDGRRHSHFDNKNSLGMPDADKIRRRQGKQTKSEPFRTEVAISRMYRVCQEFSGFIGTARLCPHSFSPPGLIAPLNSHVRGSYYLPTHKCSGLVGSVYLLFRYELEMCRDSCNGIPASIALLGDYDFFEWKEYGSRELLVYLSKSIAEPYFEGNRNIYRQTRLALFKLWRPVTFSPWLRPACLNWKSTFKSGTAGHAKFPEEVTCSGYGTTEYGGSWNSTLKRFVFAPDLCANPEKNKIEYCSPNSQCNKCNDYCKLSYFSHYTTAHREQRLTIDGNKTFCLIPNYGERLDPNRPCEFDLGAPASVMDRGHNPYCQWGVFGVIVSPKFDCSSQDPALLRVVGGELLPWLEDVVWAEEMSLADFDNSLPKCHDHAEVTFREMIHLKQ